MPVLTYCGNNSLGWSESCKRMIRSIENRCLKVISPKSSPRNCDLRLLSINNFLNKRTCSLVYDCLQESVCSPFKNYSERLSHNVDTRNNENSVKRPKVKLEFARRGFYFLGASIFNSLPLSLRSINSRVLFKEALEDFY